MGFDVTKFPSQASHMDTIYDDANYCNLKVLQTHEVSKPCPTRGDCTLMNQD